MVIEKNTVSSVMIVGTSLALGALIYWAIDKLWRGAAGNETTANFVSLAIFILVGLGAFMALMNFLSLTAQWLGVGDPKQPFGLPDGTVRAILTIAFIVLVGVLASFLLAHSGDRKPFAAPIPIRSNLPIQDAQELALRLQPDGLVALVPTTSGAAPPTTPGAPANVDVILHPRNDYRLADDVSKQILTILSTILAAMIGFYFGARPGDSSSSDPAERARLKAELDNLLGREPTVRSLEELVKQKLSIEDAAKQREVAKLKDELAEIKTKIDEGLRSIGDLSMPIEKVRTALAEATAAVARLAPLKQRLESIT